MLSERFFDIPLYKQPAFDLAGTGAISLERILAFAPILALLLFSDLGMLGLLVVAQESK